ncbi:MAG: hypothetical protein U9R25_11085 [Chloroflexota bacterium]|nr:hypothetical protein [Chloroflexota bacterium]
MYPLVLSLHSILHWIVMIVGFIAVIKAIVGWIGNSDWTSVDSRLA